MSITRVEAVDLRAACARRLGIGVGDAGGIDMAFERVVQRADEMRLSISGNSRAASSTRDQLGLHAEIAARARAPAAASPCARACRPASTPPVMWMPQDWPEICLDLLVELDRVFLQLGDVGVAVERVHAAGGVPGRAGGQLVALDQHDVVSSRPW